MKAFFYPVDFISDSNYAYAAAKIRALEAAQLDDSDYDRMLSSSNEADVLHTIETAGYRIPEKAGDMSESELIECFITDLLDLLEKLLPDKHNWFAEYFRSERDMLNLKNKAKKELAQKRTGEEPENISFANGGTIPASVLSEGTLMEISERIPQPYSDICVDFPMKLEQDAIESFRQTGAYFDRRYMEYLSELSNRIGSEFIENYTAVRIDRLNMETAVRLTRRGESPEVSLMAGGGNIDPEKICSAGDDLSRVVGSTPYSSYINSVSEYLSEQGGDPGHVEFVFDTILYDCLEYARYVTFGPEVLVAYYFRKMMEIKNIRLVMTAVRNGLERDAVREKIRGK